MGATAGRYACVLAASVPAGCLHGARRVTCAAGGGARRGSALFAQRTNLEDLFSSSSFKAEEEGEDFVSKSQSRKRCACPLRSAAAPAAVRLTSAHGCSAAPAGELRKLGQDIVALPPKTRLKLKLPARLMEVVDEWQRVGKKGGGSGPTKGKARLEALMAQCVPVGRKHSACIYVRCSLLSLQSSRRVRRRRIIARPASLALPESCASCQRSSCAAWRRL